MTDYTYRLALSEDVIGKSMVKLLEDFNIYDVGEDKALKLFYSILAHMMYYLDVHPGQYFKLNFIDITSDKENFLCVKKNSDYADDMVNPQMFYNRFCGTAVLKEELENTIDLFAKAILGVKEDKQREKRNLEKILERKAKLAEEIEECNNIVKRSKTQKQQVLKQRKEEQKQIKAYARQKVAKCYASKIELVQRERFKRKYAELEAKLLELWEENISLKEMLDKTL